jgi:hypothetical protein
VTSLSEITLTPFQRTLIEQPLASRIFLEGPAGTGKTTAGVGRLLAMLAAGVPGDSILVLAPQRTLAEPYVAALHRSDLAAGGVVSVLTIGGLARRMVDLFWPMVAEQAGFAHPDDLPTFLTLETAQYYMAHLVKPLLDHESLFDSVTMDHNRLYSQVLDNLNKAAVVGFPYREIGERLKTSWMGEPGQVRVYDDVQRCANLFREYCLAHNLLDFSLQMEVFWQFLWPSPICRDYLIRTYRHLIFDNLEEDTPRAFDLLSEWLPQFDSVLLIYDWDGGYRRFLGADPKAVYALKELCPSRSHFDQSFVSSAPVLALAASFSRNLRPKVVVGDQVSGIRDQRSEISDQGVVISDQDDGAGNIELQNPRLALEFTYQRFFPQMLDWVTEQIARLVQDEHIPQNEIVVLAPFLSDALRFSLSTRLEAFEVKARSHRPSRSLRDEPATRCLLTLAALAYPEWGTPPTKYDIAYALMQAIQGMDLVRARLLSEIVYRIRGGMPTLTSFDPILPEMQERITYRLGQRYEGLRQWLDAVRRSTQDVPVEFDHFLSRLFGEVLSQPGFGFHNDYKAGEVTANLVESVQKFRWAAGRTLVEEGVPLGKEYLAMVQDGVIAAQYIRSWLAQPQEAVLLAPAYTFLISNRPVEVQIWLDVGSRGWSERLYQPLTHPYVLRRGWVQGRLWTDADEVEAGQDALYRLVLGLLRRCRRKIYLGLSELGEQGYEQRGPLLQAFQRILRQSQEQS